MKEADELTHKGDLKDNNTKLLGTIKKMAGQSQAVQGARLLTSACVMLVSFVRQVGKLMSPLFVVTSTDPLKEQLSVFSVSSRLLTGSFLFFSPAC